VLSKIKKKDLKIKSFFVPRTGIEPVRPLGPQDFKSCVSTNSTTRALKKLSVEESSLSGKRDSDPRPRPWQGRALPTELFPQLETAKIVKIILSDYFFLFFGFHFVKELILLRL
jgi:hypothetical protein